MDGDFRVENIKVSDSVDICDSSHTEKFEMVYNSTSNSLDFNYIG